MGIGRIVALRQRLNTLPLLTMIGDAVAERGELLAEMNREQLRSGIGSDGEKLTPKYVAQPYIRLKRSLNQEPGAGTPDLLLSGDFHRSIEVFSYISYLQFRASDFKAKFLLPKYKNVLGLTQANLIRLKTEIVLPYLKRNIRNLLLP